MHSTAEAAAQSIKTSTAPCGSCPNSWGSWAALTFLQPPAVSRFSAQLLHQQPSALLFIQLKLDSSHLLCRLRPRPPRA